MEAISCPYCSEVNHTSSPESMAECAYCSRRFAEVAADNQSLVILDRNEYNVWDVAEDLMARWRESGELEKEVVVDRRYGSEEFSGEERRGGGRLATTGGRPVPA